MSLSDEIKAVLEADDSLMDLLSGGMYTNMSQLSRQAAPDAFDANAEIKPALLIKEGTEIPRGPYSRSVQTSLVIYFYQRVGFDVIESAMDIVFDLLHEQRIGGDTWQILYDGRVLDNTLGDIRDIALDCSMGVERFRAVRMK